MNESDQEMRLAMVVTEASTVQGALENLRADRLGRALELLEQQLDNSVLALSTLVEQVGPADREIVIGTLRSIRDYRRLHPRRTEADMSRIDKSVVAGVREMQDQARKILDETE